MSDYGEQEYAYDEYEVEDQMLMEEDYETKVQLQFFQAEQMLRKNQPQSAISSLQQIYQIAEQNQLKNWKIKILNLLLQIYCKANQSSKIQIILTKISELNKKQKYTESSIKSIIITIKALPKQSFDLNKDFVYQFISQLDMVGKVRSYLLFLQKLIEQNNHDEIDKLFQLINKLEIENKQKANQQIPCASLIQLYSLKIKYSKQIGKDMRHELKSIALKLSSLEAQTYMSQGHLSIIKQAISQILYLEDNYKDSAISLCEAFQENVKYGKSPESKKNLLKINLFVCLLTNDKQIYKNQKYCALFNEAASSFKGDNDIQCLFGLVEAFQNVGMNRFISLSIMRDFKFPSIYSDLFQKVLLVLKSNKLLSIIKSYFKIKLSYLQKRLNSSVDEVQKIIKLLIADCKIKGRLRKVNQEIFLDIKHNSDQFLQIKLENIKALTQKYHYTVK